MAWNYLMDMDGVLVSEEHLIPGADAFLTELRDNEIPFIVLTNNSIRTPRDLRARLLRTGLDIPESAIWTSALATARFLDSQRPGGSAYVVTPDDPVELAHRRRCRPGWVGSSAPSVSRAHAQPGAFRRARQALQARRRRPRCPGPVTADDLVVRPATAAESTARQPVQGAPRR
ncbi:hypothetical protein [Gordonia sp. OPL2]|uniref:hypothetical protein n=1 Tax=Gordonia sp. OPL2 TaxID=2486274 RepID=UPI0021CD1504|nr:hypothetical protein [Gordonia sp. OPL2]